MNSPGSELNRLAVQLGFPERMGTLCGTALDEAILKDPALARNLRDAFSSILPSQFDGNHRPGRLTGHGFIRSPKDALQESRIRFGGSYFQNERIHAYPIGKDASSVRIGGKLIDLGPQTTPAEFEKKLQTDPELRKRVETQLGGRIVLDGNADGKICIGRHSIRPGRRTGHSHHPLKDLFRRIGHRNEVSEVIRDHRTTQTPARTGPVLENLNNYIKASSPESNSAATNGNNLSSILHDPSLSFEEKLAMFMFAFLDKKQKDLEKKMEDLDKDSKKGGGFGLGSLAKIGGTVVGAVTGGGAGAIAGAKVGTEIAGIVDGGNKEEDQSKQIAMMKLNNDMQEMNQMFSLVDNMLKGMNDVVKQGPLAAIRG